MTISKGTYGEMRKVKAEMLLEGLTAEDLAEVIGSSVKVAKDKLDGRREWKRTEIRDICTKFNWPSNYFFDDIVDRTETDR